MTSPRQRKKRLAFERMKAKLEQKPAKDHKPLVIEKQVEPPKTVATPSQPVVESEAAPKQKKSKNGLFELKSQVETLDQTKEEVKTQTKE